MNNSTALKTSVVKSPSNNVARWMVAYVPDVKSNSALVLKGTYPSYLFEIIPPAQSSNCIKIDYLGETYYVLVKLDIDNAGAPPNSYLLEMLRWYSKCKAKPTLNKINASNGK